MDNFTPLKVEKKKRKINKFLIFGNLFLVVLVAAIGIFYYNQTLITTKQKALESGVREECQCIYQDNTKDDYWCLKPNGNASCPGDSGAPKPCNTSGGYCDAGYTCFDVVESCGAGGGDKQKCPNGQPPVCDTTSAECSRPAGCQFPKQLVIPIEKCGQPDDLTFMCYQDCTCEVVSPTPTPTPPDVTNTPTPTPTPTDVITNTPTPTSTPTPTPTDVITNTPTPTPTGTIVPSNTPTVTPTNTPGPSATPTPTDVPGEPTATPTEIILAQTTVTSPPVPVTGMVQSFMYLIPALIIFVGLIL